MRILIRIAKLGVLLALGAMLSGWVWLFLESRAPTPPKAEPPLFEVAKGLRVRDIAAALKAGGFVRKEWPLVLSYELFYAPRTIKAGEYLLPRSGAVKDILETLVRGTVFLHPVTIAEGLTAAETIAEFLAAGFGPRAEFDAAFRVADDIALWDPQARDLEGYLFPETYRLPKGLSPRDIFREMISTFKTAFGERGRSRAAEMRMTVREAVILASLIEKETARSEEKRLVASVFHNRLKLGMKLDCDPTIIYALKLRGEYAGRLRTKDLKLDSPYNTYQHAGLPPGPICNPGTASLAAALDPQPTEYLYFVSRNDGSHHFSRTLAEHNRAVKKYQE